MTRCALLLTGVICLLAAPADAQERGRKYTPPPPVAHVLVTVTKGVNNKPVEGAAIIFHTERNGHDQGNLEVKTNEEGKAVIDVIPIGDTVRLQVFKTGYQTFGADYDIDSATKEIAVKMKPPSKQYSMYDKPGAETPKPEEGSKPAATPPQ